jgi:predicted SAM-dependent methyltransferase
MDRGEARRLIVDHIDRIESGAAHVVNTSRGSLLTKVRRRAVPPAARFAARVAATRAQACREKPKAAALVAAGNRRVHLASGTERKDGWINVDLAGYPVDVAWDLRQPLPFEDASVDAVFHEHFLGYMTLREAFALYEEIHRILTPGGIFRAGVTDCGRIDESYPDAPTFLLGLLEFHASDPGNRVAYDEETLRLLTEGVGFVDVERKPFGDSLLVPCPDTARRQRGTLYLEARKPAASAAS